MRLRNLTGLAAALGLAALLAVPSPAQTDARGDAEGVEVLARGPVHEAYAEPSAGPEAPPVVPKEPPDPIEEAPPEQRPDGENVQWVPGYWAWDEEASEFLWVSGFWRDVPPDRRWVPGAWQRVDDGWQWVAGFWAPAEQQELEYLQPPPESIERGPSVPGPAEDSAYVPGCWVWRETRYNWRPGFWVDYRPGWVYTPAKYNWTPAGCVFVDGYWDHPLHDRGLLFSPVRFARGFDRRFVPRYVVNHDFLLTALFVRPATRHYYFGDYFEERYTKRGFVPWVDYRVARTLHDPNFAYYRHTFRGDRWESNLRDLYVGRFEGNVPRPPRTLVQQAKVIQNIENVRIKQNINVTNLVTAVTPINRVADARVTALAGLAGERGAPRADVQRVVKLAPVPREERARVEKSVTQIREVARTRQKVETRVGGERPRPDRPGERREAVRLELPKPVVTPPRADRPGRPEGPRKAPPPPLRAPRPEERPGTRPDRPDPPKPPVRPGQDRPPTDRPPPTRDRPPPDRPPRVDPPRPVPPRDRPSKDQPPRQEPPRDRPPPRDTPPEQPSTDRPPPRVDPPRQEPPRPMPPRQDPPRRPEKPPPPPKQPDRPPQPPRQTDPPRPMPPQQPPRVNPPPRQEPPRPMPPRVDPPRPPAQPPRPPAQPPRPPASAPPPPTPPPAATPPAPKPPAPKPPPPRPGGDRPPPPKDKKPKDKGR